MAAEPTYEELLEKVREFEDRDARRKQAERALRASEARLVENLKENYFLYSHDPAGRLTFVSPTITNVLGYTQEEFVGNFREYLTDNPLNYIDSHSSARHRQDAHEPSYMIEIVHKDGSLCWLDITEVPIFDSAGSLVAVECIAHDISARKRAELQVMEEKNKLEAVFATIGDGLIIVDTEYRILYQNLVFRERFGEHVGRHCFRAQHLRDEVCEDCPLRECFADGRVHRIEITMPSDTGFSHIEIAAGPIRDSQGIIVGGFEVVRDITEHKRLVAQFIQAQKMESVGRLAGGVAHDFNNLLTGIMGYAELSLEQTGTTDPSLRDDLKEIMSLSRRAADLTRQLLAFGRQQVLEAREVNINQLIDNLSKMLRRLIGEDLEFGFYPAEDIGLVKADPGQIEQILTNLAINARDAMSHGGKLSIETVNICFDETEGFIRNIEIPPGPYVMFSVTDTGCGMDKATQEQIFEPFFTTKKVGDGSGLGLSTVYGIVKQHRGFIWVYSEPGEGTTFKVYLPAIDGPEVAVQETRIVSRAPKGTGTILVVEDDADVRRITLRMLRRLGYSVLVAEEPDEAEKIFKEKYEQIDFLLTDVVMPKRSGKEMYRNMAERNPALKVLFMSGYPRDTIANKGFLDADAPLINKPFSQESLGKKIKEILQQENV